MMRTGAGGFLTLQKIYRSAKVDKEVQKVHTPNEFNSLVNEKCFIKLCPDA